MGPTSGSYILFSSKWHLMIPAKLALIVLLLLSCAVADTNLPKEHSHVAGDHDINDFTINWTDSRNHTDIASEIFDTNLGTTYDPIYEAHYYVRSFGAARNNVTLFIRINWHPYIIRPSDITLDALPWEIENRGLVDRSDLKIQGQKALLLTYKEIKEYQGSEQEPDVIPANYEARYFLDGYTEVLVSGDLVDWSLDEFKSMLSSLEITPPSGYY